MDKAANRKVLIIAYQFPPRGGPGVHRTLNFVRHLPEFGYEPVVLSVQEEEYKKANEQLDYSLLAKVPPEVKVERTPSFRPFNFIRIANRLRVFRFFWFFAWPLFWEPVARWPFKVYKTAARLVKENDIDIVYTTSGPFSAWILGYLLKKRLKVKWVADLRDPFTDGYMWLFPSRLHWYLARRAEKWLLSRSDIVIVNTPEVRKKFISRKIKDPSKIVFITNGF